MKQQEGLIKVLGVGFGVAMLVGSTIGVGILKMPGTVATCVPDATIAILLWVLAGLFALLGALLYAEAGVAYPYAGGPFAIINKVFGKGMGFTVGFCDWVLNVASCAALAIASSEYLVPLLGFNISIPSAAVAMIVVFALVQWFGIKSSSIIQKILSLLKGLGLLFLVSVFFMYGKTEAGSISTSVVNSNTGFIGAIILSFRSIIYSYAGWNSPVYFTEENKDHVKALPGSLIYGVISITVIYVLVNLSLFTMLPVNVLASSHLAVADASGIVFGASGKLLVTIISVIIVASCFYAGMLYAPRIIFGVAREGLFFSALARVNKFHSPGMALIVSTLLMIVFAASGAFDFVIAIFVFLYVCVDISVYAATLYSRMKNKTVLEFKAPIFPVLHVFMILTNLVLLASVFMEETRTSLYAIGVIASTVPLYFIFKFSLKGDITKHS